MGKVTSGMSAEFARRYDEEHCRCTGVSENDLCERQGCSHALNDHGFHIMFCLECGCMTYICPRCHKEHPGL